MIADSQKLPGCLDIQFIHKYDNMHFLFIIWERIWEKGPIGNFFTNSIPEKLPF